MRHPLRLFFVLIACITFSSEAFAIRPRAQQFSGVVELLDLPQKKITVSSKVFRLTHQTRYIAQSQFVEPADLIIGTPVTVHYRTPLIGDQFATRVSWPTHKCAAR